MRPIKRPGPLSILFVARMVVTLAPRIVYPFLPSLARGLGVSLAAATWFITLRQVPGLAAPFLGPVVDRSSRRRMMELALLIVAFASLLLVGWSAFPVAAIAFVLYGLAKVLYDPAVYAYLGDTVPYGRRGRAVGFLELTWALAWLIGVPASGFLIERWGWRAPWAALGILGILGLGFTRLGLPPARRPAPDAGEASGARAPLALLRSWRDLLRRPRVVVLLLTSVLSIIAIEVTFVVYGAWLETSFGLSLSTLGLASIVVGVAEASAELGTTVLTDRLGKKRSVLTGLLGLAASLVVLPGLARLGLAGALAGVVLVMLTFEFGIVSLLPLVTELAPEARATLVSLNAAAFSLGRIAGAATGGLLWQGRTGGIALNAWVGAGCALVAASLMAWGMVEIGDERPQSGGLA
jgi:predicted MFS family arabinose efflux permease